MPQSGIYAIRNSVNGFCYVGSAVDFQVRKVRHLRELRQGIHHSRHLQAAFNLYGEAAFVFTMLEEVEKEKQLLFQRESHWIQTLKPEYNVGQLAHTHLGVKRADATKKLMSEKASLRKHTEASKQKMREAKLGKKHSEEVKQKRAESLKGRKYSEETVEQIRQSNLGKKRSDEARANISKAHIGIKRSEESCRKQSETMKGATFSEERRKRISEGRKAAWDRKKREQAETLDIEQNTLFD